ncbi:DUF4202 domain-containing protein [Sphingobacterium bambusae]|uniref:DUF4202 domain-containing protein n=1 Tax=Sphingobacterium bambusae TaxID=662858 RepID=A0ABW6BKE3_9SPHI|nr:DUF4202 domain-containing protein [Sphingobacterium bambusae]WPL49874.1 DUF4202 domain-containing protein [Sphingobacterium bambusae]
MSEKLQQAFERFDTYNKKDPNSFRWQGQDYPQEYFLALKLHEWVQKLDPQASEPLLLASRSQHIGRWESPRKDYPMDRSGYLLWRKELAQHHANVASTILQELGYDEATLMATQQIILKKKIKVEADVQTMENALCLVFLEFQYADFFPKHEDKIVEILRKSLLKMDAHGHQFALQLPYSEAGLAHIQAALALLAAKGQ